MDTIIIKTAVASPDFRMIRKSAKAIAAASKTCHHAKATSAPYMVVAPSPPLNFKKTDQLWPTTAINPAISTTIRESVRSWAINTADAPSPTSIMTTSTKGTTPSLLCTAEALIRPSPSRRISIFPIERPMI